MISEKLRQGFPETDILNLNTSTGGTCRGITKQGKRCKKHIGKGSGHQYCHLHRDQATIKAEPSEILGPRSSEPVNTSSLIAQTDSKLPNGTYHGITAKGEHCKSPAKKGFCHHHQYQESTQEIKPSSERIATAKIERDSTSVETPPYLLSTDYSTPSPPSSPSVRNTQGLLVGTSSSSKFTPLPSPPASIRARTNSRQSSPLGKSPSTVALESLEHSPLPTQSTPDRYKSASLNRTSVSPTIERSREKKWVPGPDDSGMHIDPNDFLHPKLSPECREKILHTINKVLSRSEIAGYIYAFTIEEANSENGQGNLIKVGRTQNVEKRLKQWRGKCGIDPTLVVRYPEQSPSITSLAKKIKCTRLVERLIHLELEDRLGNANSSGLKCKCGAAHREWFRGDKDVVREVIYHWASFSKIAYGEVSD